MKIEKLLLGLFASFLMVGCSQNDDAPNASEEAKGKDSYVSIRIFSDNTGSRADQPIFSAGNQNENAVNSVHFFFFDENGNAFEVPVPTETEADGGSAVVEGIDDTGSKFNWIKIDEPSDDETYTPAEGDNVNVEKMLDAIVVFKVQNNTYPSQIIAVLNWDYNGTAPINKTNLMQQLINEATALGSDGSTGFIMSNSVYKDASDNQTIDAKAISAANFAPTPGAAKTKEKAIELHVERVAVKVKVNVDTNASQYKNIGTTDEPVHAFEVAETPNIYGEPEDKKTPIYAQILAWDLNTTNTESFLVKQLGSDFTSTYPYTGWNDAGNKRSYYANAYDGSYNSKFTWGGINNTIGSSDYCLENTNTSEATKVVVKARLVVKKTGNESVVTYEPVTVCQWYSSYYVGLDALKQAVAESVNIYEKGMDDEGKDTYSKISAANINVTAKYNSSNPDSYDAYKVTFSVSSTASDGTPKKWYMKDGDTNKYTEYSNVNSAFIGMSDAKVWQHGATYYFTDIKHENSSSAVIRNHLYSVSINAVYGLGTPVYYPSDDPGVDPNPDPSVEPEIPEPVVPEDKETYIAAQINVLSWKLVSNKVELGH